MRKTVILTALLGMMIPAFGQAEGNLQKAKSEMNSTPLPFACVKSTTYVQPVVPFTPEGDARTYAFSYKDLNGEAVVSSSCIENIKLSDLKKYVVDYVTLQNLPMPLKHGSKVDLRPVTKKIFIYTDTLSHTLPCKLHLSVNKKGYIKDCRVEGEVFPPLAERIKNVVLNYPDRIMEKGALKDKRMLNVSIDLLLPFAGNYVFLDTGLEDLNGFLMDFANCLMMSHPQNRPDSPIMEWNPFLHAPLSGRFCMGWVIEKDGSIGVYKKMADSLFPEYVYEIYMRWLNHYGGYSEYLINVPVINNVAVPVWVVADYDFDAMTMGFKCYMIKEEDDK